MSLVTIVLLIVSKV